MIRLRFVRLALVSAALVTIGCEDESGPSAPEAERFTSTMNGANEKPTARTTPATGSSFFTLRRDTLYWTLTLSNITNVNAAHIHTGAADVNGGVILFLTPGTTGTNNSNIAGFVTRSTFVTPNPPNAGVTFDSLLVLMRTSNSYVNVHTNNTANDPVNNTGPGDFPGGEIRGQVVPAP